MLKALLERTMARSKTKAIEVAIREYLDKKAMEDIIDLSGKIHIDPDWEQEEKRELDEYRDRG